MILPGATIGLLGGGQLGRMIGVAARRLGYGVAVYSPPGDNPAVQVADRAFLAAWDDAEALAAFAAACDVVTYEFENVPVATVEAVAAHTRVAPGAALLGYTQDRLHEHALLDELGIHHAPGRAVHDPAEFDAALAALGMPSRLKTARGGYDGGGQWRIRSAADVAVARAVIDGSRTFRFERDVRFDREISVIVARTPLGEERVFPVFENEHRDGILWLTRWPARVSPAVEREATRIARRIADRVGLVGTLTVECFVVGDDVLVNELAPRVHNSGHLTIEGCAVSQFEQHVRAICGLPLAEPLPRGPVAMANVLGDVSTDDVTPGGMEMALGLIETHVHLYGKRAVRPRRKLGHVTALGATSDEAVERATTAAGAITWKAGSGPAR